MDQTLHAVIAEVKRLGELSAATGSATAAPPGFGGSAAAAGPSASAAAPDPFAINDPWNESRAGPTLFNISTPFRGGAEGPGAGSSGAFPSLDLKIAKSPEYAYNPKAPEVWVKDVKNYCVGQHAEMIPFFEWVAARQMKEIKWSDLRGMSTKSGGPAMLDRLDPVLAAQKLWSFLNLAVMNDSNAKRTFLNVDSSTEPRRGASSRTPTTARALCGGTC